MRMYNFYLWHFLYQQHKNVRSERIVFKIHLMDVLDVKKVLSAALFLHFLSEISWILLLHSGTSIRVCFYTRCTVLKRKVA